MASGGFPAAGDLHLRAGRKLAAAALCAAGEWFSGVEARLLGVLEEGAAPAVESVLAGLPAPMLDRLVPNARRVDFKGGRVVARQPGYRHTELSCGPLPGRLSPGGARQELLVGAGHTQNAVQRRGTGFPAIRN